MAELVTIARPYAQAIFSLAKETGTQSAWSKRLGLLAMLVEVNEMVKVIENPGVSTQHIVELLVSLTEEKECKELTAFITLLAENERLLLLPFIRNIYCHLKDIDEGIQTVELESAFPIDDKQLQALTAELAHVFSSNLKPQLRINPALIGGFKAKVGSRVYDASIRGKLDVMSTALKKN